MDTRTFIFRTFPIITILLYSIGLAGADTREEAIRAVADLKHSEIADTYPEMILNVNSLLNIAEQYHQALNFINAQNYYLYAMQQAHLLNTLNNPSPLLTAPTITKEINSEQIAGKSQANLTVPANNDPPLRDPDINQIDQLSEQIVGEISTYTVIKGDTLRLIAAKLGVNKQQLTTMNRLAPNSVLKAGQKLTYNNRKIVPKSVREGIVVNIPDRTLYYFKQGKLVRWLPVALGSATRNDKYVWQTPTGKFRITDKLQNPTWYVPVSIRSEMEEKGKEVLTAVPPGIDNPLGKYAIKTSIPGIMIHSTTKPWSIYGFVSHGCIRVTPADMEEFFREIKINTTGEIIYEPIKLTVTESGKIFIEVHQDIYEKGIDYLATANNLINKLNLSDRINWSTFKTVLKQKSGVAVDISL